MRQKRLLMNFFLTALLVLTGQMALAQGSTTSGMNGVVTDEAGEPLIGATVQATHQPSGTTYGNVTNIDGRFILRNMRVGGPYRVVVTYVGFDDVIKDNIFLQLGRTNELDIVMREGTTELQEIVVTGERGIIDGNRTGAETNVTEEEINSLPTANRNLTDFVRLTPQASITETGDGPAISIAGQNNRFNSIYIDGAVNNDVFGLAGSGTNGGQTGVSPISIDAIEQFNVAVSPYDVTLGGFTGGSVNAITRSGTNDFKGSVYYFFRNEDLAGKTPTDNDDVEREKLGDFAAETYGFRLGGPIIKNKLFFFVNGEIQRDETPQPFVFEEYQDEGGSYTEQDFENLQNFLNSQYGYDAGDFRNNLRERNSDKFLAKINWNINQNHKLSIRHSYTYAEEVEAQLSNPENINFRNNAEFFPSTTNSTSLEVTSNFGNNLSNKFILGYTRVNDDRGSFGDPFPRVVIRDPGPDADAQLNIGTEPFSVGNLLEQDVWTLTNNFSIFAGKHSITIGTHNEFYDILNLFIRENYGVYEYASIDDFINDAGPLNYSRTYTIFPEIDAAQGDDALDVAAQFKALQLGFYVQDEIQLNDKLRMNLGLRLDVPMFLDDPVGNEDFNQNSLPLMEAQYSVRGARSGKSPDAQFMLSPRWGFNYDVFGDQSLQVRGGAGIFTGRIPFVWPGGAYTNNGVFLADIDINDPVNNNGDPLPFRPDPNNQYTAGDIQGAGIGGGSQIDLFTEDFRFPQVARTSLAADVQLPLGLVGTVEAVYTKNLNAIYYQNINLARATTVMGQQPDGTIEGADNRPVYTNGSIDPNYGRVLLASNTDQGYTYNLTAQVQRPWRDNWTANVSYTFGRSKAVFEGTSSQNSSNWRNTYAVDKNDVRLGFTDFDAGHRIIASVSYRKEYLNHFASQLSLFYTGQSGDRYSFTYFPIFFGGARTVSGNNLSGRNFNDPIYIPRTADEINLIDITDGDGNVTKTAAQQWEELDAFIEDDPYLSNHRGEYAEENAGRLPFQHILDLKFVQDFFVDVNGKRNTLQLTFDVFNFTNLLNKDWGRRRNTRFGDISVIDFEGFVDPNGGDFTPQFTFDGAPYERGEQGNIDDTGIYSSRWQAQVGIRYIFN